METKSKLKYTVCCQLRRKNPLLGRHQAIWRLLVGGKGRRGRGEGWKGGFRQRERGIVCIVSIPPLPIPSCLTYTG